MYRWTLSSYLSMFFLARKFLEITLFKFLFFLSRKILISILIILCFLGSITYVVYPYIKSNFTQKHTADYLDVVQKLYNAKDSSDKKSLVLDSLESLNGNNKVFLIFRELPDLDFSSERKIAIMQSILDKVPLSPIVYDLLIMKLCDYSKLNDSIVLLKKIHKDHPLYFLAQKKIIYIYLAQKDYSKAHKTFKYLKSTYKTDEEQLIDQMDELENSILFFKNRKL
jgi:hypothetical protein